METAAATANAQASKTSRVGKRPVDVPKGVTISVNARNVQIKGPKGELVRPLAPTTDIKLDGDDYIVLNEKDVLCKLEV